VVIKSIVPLVANEVILHQSILTQPLKVALNDIHELSEGKVILVKLAQLAKALAIVVTELSVAGNFTEVKLAQLVHMFDRSVALVLAPEISSVSRLTQPVKAWLKLVALDIEIGITTLERPVDPLKQF
jgi:hypothetical protein